MRHRLKWLWEFSKRAVVLCTAFYAAGFAYAMLAMWLHGDFQWLGTFIEQTADVLKVCVFGYLVKAGVENIFKIRSNGGGGAPQDGDGGGGPCG